jgi:hypothetical protein
MLVSQVWVLCGHNLGSLFWMAGCKIMRGQPFAVAFAFSLSHAQNNDEWIGLLFALCPRNYLWFNRS